MSADMYLEDIDKPLHVEVRCYLCRKLLREGEVVGQTHEKCAAEYALSDITARLPIVYEIWCDDGR